MTTSEANPEDVQEQQRSVLDEPPAPEGELPDEAPEADVMEQRIEIVLDDEDAPIG
ncbi:MAG: hypothetical protein M3P04_09330 [Actinomycetota bacterium]|nr:hypothetical protein [Actinomycetota bacterium]